MPFSLRSRSPGRHNQMPTPTTLAISTAESEQLVRLELAKQTMRERLTDLLGERQTKSLSLQGLRRLTLHKTAIDVGGVIVDIESPQTARTNFDLAPDGSRLEIVTHNSDKSEQYRFLGRGTHGVVFERGDSRYALTSPLAHEGLERLEQVCEQLGVFCLNGSH